MLLVFVVARAAACFRLRCDGRAGSLLVAKGKRATNSERARNASKLASFAAAEEERYNVVVSAKERERKGMRRKRVLLRF